MNEVCSDNRFEIIEKAKMDLLESTNINTDKEEMKVLDNFLFRCWQMGWLGKYDQPMTNADRIRNMTDEELAEFLVYIQSTIKECMIGVADCKYENTDKDCKDCFLEWLQAEVKEGE